MDRFHIPLTPTHICGGLSSYCRWSIFLNACRLYTAKDVGSSLKRIMCAIEGENIQIEGANEDSAYPDISSRGLWSHS